MSYLTQMLGLTVQNFVSAATGMATLVALHPRLRAPLGRDHRQLLGGSDPDHALHPAAALASSSPWPWCPRAWSRPSAPTPRSTVVQPTQYDEPETDKDGKPVLDEKGQPKMKKSTLTEQVIAVGPAASQIAIKQLGTNGGGFFNVNSAPSVRELHAVLELPRAAGDPRDLGRALLHVRRHGQGHAPGLDGPRGDDRDLRGAPGRLRTWRSRTARVFVKQGVDHTAERAPAGRQHGGQGGPLRHRQLCALGDRDHRRVQRLGQLDARFLSRRSAGSCRCG